MVLTAKDILEKDFLSVPTATFAFEAAKLMKLQRHGFDVTYETGKPVGIH